MAVYTIWMLLLSIYCFFLLASSLPRVIRGRPLGGMLGKPAGQWFGLLPPDQWIQQRLDHFDDSDTRTWKQRYFVNGTFHKPGGPVFVMIGGEGTASPLWMVMGQWIKYAQHFNALCLQLEHRYYGKSHPTSDLSTENLRFLSSEQALADLAFFRQYITETMGVSGSKWITFGGSYPGSLSAWFRLKYPHLVHGAVATSAPVFAILDFKDYLGVVKKSLETSSPECVTSIQKATTTIEQLVRTPEGRKKLQSTLKLCDPLDLNNELDIANFYNTLAGNFEGVVQYNKDNRKFEGAVDTNVTIDLLCGIMTDSHYGDALHRYATVNTLHMKTYGEKCLDYKYDKMISEMQNTDWSSSAGEGGRQWTYQTCTEFGFFQSSDLAQQPFGHKFPVGFSVQQCKDIFGDKFGNDLITLGINRTNTNYGGFGLKVSRVIFPNGSIDPWHALGITSDISKDAVAIFINGTAHCANMYPDSPSDPPNLVKARQQIQNLIGQWMTSELN